MTAADSPIADRVARARLFPYLGERAIGCMTGILLPTLSQRYRSWLYSRIRRR